MKSIYGKHAWMVGILILLAPSCKAPDNQVRPNILLVMCDQLRFDRSGIMGDRNVRTPNIDALAGEGFLFKNAYW